MLKQRLKDLRIANGYTKKRVSEVLAMSPEGYGYYESGVRTPSPDTVAALAEFYGVTTDYLLGRTDDPAPLGEKKGSPDIELSDIEFALIGEVREFDDDIKQEILDDFLLLMEVKRLRQLKAESEPDKGETDDET